MRAVSLFSGAGGFEIGFGRAGIRTVLQAECDPWALAVLRRHWPDVERVTDVRDIGGVGEPACRSTADAVCPAINHGGRQAGSGIPDGVDLIYGGFPCQDVSVAGKRAGLAGERTGLWSEFRRVLRELRPRFVCAENVPGLLSSDRGRDFGRILADLDGLGYGVAWRVLDARFFGVPQRRRRVFVVGCLGDPVGAAQVLAVCPSCGGHPAPRREARQGVAAGARSGAEGVGKALAIQHGFRPRENYSPSTSGINIDVMYTLDGFGDHAVGVIPEIPARCVTARGNRLDSETDTLLIANTVTASAGHSSPRGDGADNLIAFNANGHGEGGESVPTLRVGTGLSNMPTGSAVAYGAGVRRLTPRECERLMGWPDDWTRWTDDGREIPDSHRYRMCGNGVVAPVAEWIGHRLVAVDALMRMPS